MLETLYDACVKVLWAFLGMTFLALVMWGILSELARLAQVQP